MAMARYKYSSQIVQETEGTELAVDQVWWVEKDLEGSAGMLFQVSCAYSGGSRGLTVVITQGIAASRPADHADAAILSFEMPTAGTDVFVTIPLLMPEVGPKVVVHLHNTSGGTVFVTACSRRIEGVEIV